MKFAFKLACVPLVLLPLIFFLMPNALGAAVWQALSLAWLMWVFLRSMK